MDAEPPLDQLDLDLVAAMQIAPRVGLNVLAKVLDTSASTIGRRLGRLEQDGLLRVVGQLDWSLISDTHPHHVWISTRPGTARRVAEALTTLPETQYVATTAGRADIHLTVHSRSRAQTSRLLTEQVAGIEDIVSTNSELVLRAASKADQWRLRTLDEQQFATLRAESPATGDRHPNIAVDTLTGQERAVAQLLHVHGRTPASEVARLLSLSRSTAHRIVQSLLSSGVVQPRVEVEPALVGFPLEAAVHLAVKPGDTTTVAQWCAGHSSARYVSVVAGDSSVVHQGVFRDEDDLAEFLEGDLAELPGITGRSVSVVLEVLQRYFLRRDRGRIVAEASPFADWADRA